MKKTDKKSYYAVIPANVRYDPSLPANAKLLYGEITALCSEKGFCWASNNYFAKLYNKDKGTISRWISQLIDQGYIQTEVDKEDGNKRKLWLSVSAPTPIDKNDNTYRQKRLHPIGKNAYSYRQKSQAPIGKNAYHNNKDNTTVNNTDNKRKPSKKDLSPKNQQHYACTLLRRYGIELEVARSIVYDQNTPLASIEETIKNGLAKEEKAQRTGGKFVLEAGYIIKALNTAHSEGKIVGPTKSNKRLLIAKLAASKTIHTPLEPKEFEKRKRRSIAALSASK
jgi:hypothetical protein